MEVCFKNDHKGGKTYFCKIAYLASDMRFADLVGYLDFQVPTLRHELFLVANNALFRRMDVK